jgi:hypothetical protein
MADGSRVNAARIQESIVASAIDVLGGVLAACSACSPRTVRFVQ